MQRVRLPDMAFGSGTETTLGSGLAGRIARGYLTVLRALAFVGAVVLGAAACGVVIAVPLWLLATRATEVYNWLVVAAAAGLLGSVGATRLLRGARRAPSVARYLRTSAFVAVQVAARGAGVLIVLLLEVALFVRWGTLPGLLALPVTLILVGLLLFIHPTATGAASIRQKLSRES